MTPGPELRLDQRLADELADTMFALSAPSRVQILACLMGGALSVTQLTEALGMEQSAVSHQLRVLRDHALVRAERVGRNRLYALSDEHVAVLLTEALRHVEARSRTAERIPRTARGAG
ncbi:MAG TPA: metalloregulator ArsR/SmtB family transcription factor [Acidimicrobiales bacterium]|nr:metalloregulator ArsR/SmtB family transcription factor [Acidimicrobiales bacterium]